MTGTRAYAHRKTASDREPSPVFYNAHNESCYRERLFERDMFIADLESPVDFILQRHFCPR
jgi:hypothetical protein